MQASRWLKTTQFWLLPGLCVVCRRPSGLQRDLCEPCLSTFARIARPCRSCALPLPSSTGPDLCGACIGRDQRFMRTAAAFAYTEPLSTLVAGFKYRAGLPQGRVLGDLLLSELRSQYAGSPLPELLIPVPLHRTRLRERGFNQALVLARQLGAALTIPVVADALIRSRSTPAQRGLSARQRKQNLRGAFALDRSLGTVRTLALIDDVVTTMSTMHEIAQLLRLAYPELELHAWCVARA
jgi:ComF family protein